MINNKGLGKGLSALLKEEIVTTTEEIVRLIGIDNIEPGIYQPRKHFDYDRIKELADSIRNTGLLQPIIVSTIEKGKYQIIAGERRWRAAKIAGLDEIPVIVKNSSNQELLKISLLENIQREELSAIEEAEGFARLMKEFNYTQEELAELLSKSRSHIANVLRLNHLPQSIKDKVNEGHLTMGHAKCLVGNEHAESIAQYIVENDLSVRQSEQIVKNWHKSDHIANNVAKKRFKISSDNEEMDSLAHALSQKLDTKVIIENYLAGGRLILYYDDLEKLDNILSKIG